MAIYKPYNLIVLPPNIINRETKKLIVFQAKLSRPPFYLFLAVRLGEESAL